MKRFLFIVLALFLSNCGPASRFDPALAAQQAQSQAEYYAMIATGTAQSQIIPITQTAAAISIQQTQAVATSIAGVQTQGAIMTITAQSWTPTPDATQTAVFARSYAEATQMANQAIEDNNRLERQHINNIFYPILWAAFFAVVAYIGINYSRVHRHQPIARDEYGKTQPMIDVVTGEYIDLSASPNYTHVAESLLKQMFIQYMEKKYSFVRSTPRITAERQDNVKEREQVIEIQRIRRARLPKALIDAQTLKFLPELVDEPTDLRDADLLLPEWAIINNWDGQSRPLGLGRKGIITAQAASPHLLVSGKTGTGKTGFMLRTQATASLAKGYQVINLGFSDSGFGVFMEQPNYHAVKLDQASDIIPCLASVYKELKERKAMIGGASIEWDHWPQGNPPRPFVDLLIDELGNIAEDIYMSEETTRDGAAKTKELWRWLSMIANEGRKVGIRFVAALQDPTAKSVDLRFRRNCTLVSFQQGDASQSSAFLGTTGAELLQVGHFMARTDGLVIGGGFAPTDDDIRAYLRQHAAPVTPPPMWIDGVVSDQPTLSDNTRASLPPSEPKAETLAQLVSSLSDEGMKIFEMCRQGSSQREIERVVFGSNGGSAYEKVAEVVRRYKAAYQAEMGATTTPINPNLGAFAT